MDLGSGVGASGVDGWLVVGDPRRRAVGRAAFGALWTSVAFFLFTVPTKQVKGVYGHAPWLNDPYDAVYSFAMFFVPLIAAFFLLQVSLCLKTAPVPVARVRSILRGCHVGVTVMSLTVVSCWISVADGANRSEWTASTMVPLVAGLLAVTVMVAGVVAALVRAPRFATPAGSGGPGDWLGDAIAVANRETRWFGPLRPVVRQFVSWLERTIITDLRRHPALGAGVASAVFGVGVGVNQSVREHYYSSSTLLTVGLLACGMFGFLMVAGSYLRVVRATSPMHGVPRRVLDAGVTACVAAIVTLAFRNSLWWTIGTTEAATGNGQFAVLVGAGMLVAFVATLTVESVLQTHPGSA